MLRRIFYLVNSICVNLRYRHNNVRVALNSRIKPGTSFGKNIRIGEKTWIKGSIGSYSYIGRDCRISAYIGNFCSIAPGVKTVEGTHSIEYLSTSPAFLSDKKQCGYSFTGHTICDEELLADKENGVSVRIGNDVWIGEDVMIKGGVSIGDGAVIAMGAVVTKDVEPFTVVGGVPAKIIEVRFSEEKIKECLQEKWWLKDETWLKAHLDRFQNRML